jgi:hypothetical protein
MNFYVVYTFVIPISVFISVEMCRIVQALWMIWDEDMRSYTDGPLSQAELEEIAAEQDADSAGVGAGAGAGATWRLRGEAGTEPPSGPFEPMSRARNRRFAARQLRAA